MARRLHRKRHCQLNRPRAPFCGPARLERGSTIGEQRTFRRATNILSDGEFELVLANAAHVKNVPGRKTDIM
jgi:hypothetical protein